MEIGDKIKIIKNRYEILENGMERKIYKIDFENDNILYGAIFNNLIFWFYEDEIEKIGE